MLQRGLVAVWLSISIAGCRAPVHGSLSAAGFQQPSYGYRIDVGADGRLLPKGWKLDNYYHKKVGEKSRLVPKTTPEYQTFIQFDYDGDGKADARKRVFLEELRWIHARSQAVIWVRSIPVSRRLRHIDLDVLIADYIDEISGAGYESIAFGKQEMREHRYVAKLLRKTLGTLAGQEAIDAEVEVANSEQLKLDPNARSERVRLILVRGPVDDVETSMGESHNFPVFVVLGYANGPEHYAEGAPDFEGLLSRFAIGEHRGLVVPAASTVPSPAAPVDKPSPAPGVAAPAAPAAAPAVPDADAGAITSPDAAPASAL